MDTSDLTVSPDVNRLAVISNARADTKCEVSSTGVSLYGVVEVVGHSGAICQLEAHSVPIDQRTVQSRDHTLNWRRLMNK